MSESTTSEAGNVISLAVNQISTQSFHAFAAEKVGVGSGTS